ERPDGIQFVQLRMQAVAAVLSSQQYLVIGECQVVKRGMILIAQHHNGNYAIIAAVRKVHAENGAPRAASRQRRSVSGSRVRVSRRTEEQRAELRTRLKLGVFRPLERSGAGSLRLSVGAKARTVGSAPGGIMHVDPLHRPG